MPTRSGIGISCLAAAAVVAAMVWLVLIVEGAHAHEGHDHAAPTNRVATSLPRIAVQSELYQLVGILEGGRLTLYLDRFSDNAPVTTGRIAVTVDGEAATTRLTLLVRLSLPRLASLETAASNSYSTSARPTATTC